jgi:protein-disulfide isomerase
MTMQRHMAGLAAIIGSAVMLAAAPAEELRRADIEAIVQEYLAAHPEVVERIVKDYLIKNPDAVGNAFAEIVKRHMATAPDRSRQPATGPSAAIQKNAALLFDSTHQASLGNARGDVTLVEFFDYNCGYCKRALDAAMSLLRDDAGLRIVLKEFPVLGPRSVEAAQVSIAARMQDQGGAKFLDFHRRMLGARAPVDKVAALAIAEEAGFDLARIERDLSGDEVRDTLDEARMLAREVGIRGTPGYVVGANVIPGAIGAAGLKEKIAAARGGGRDQGAR